MVEQVRCGRVGCGQPSTSVLLIAPQEQIAWVVGPDHPAAPDGVPLCLAHADRISVPFGWVLHDERPLAQPVRRAARSRKRTRPEPEATLPSEPDPKVASAVEPVDLASPAEPDADALPDADDAVAEDRADPGRRRHHPSSPSATPLNADEVAAAIGDAGARLSVVPGDDDYDKTYAVEPDGQTALWAEPHAAEHEPDDSTPLLKRAFRVVRDD